MFREFNESWVILNETLQPLESNAQGLVGALEALYAQQLSAGFVKDNLENVERYSFHAPDNAKRFFRVQFNPNRALRFSGSGKATPPAGFDVPNEGCFLCRDNIGWQQAGAQLGYDMELGGWKYHALTNPFPLLPVHLVVATTDHQSQEWRLHHGDESDECPYLQALVELCVRMPGYIGFYNGVEAGASIPGHMHFQIGKRPGDAPRFALEQAAGDLVPGEGVTGFVRDYPLEVAVWKGGPAQVKAQATVWIQDWARQNHSRIGQLSANLIAASDAGSNQVTLYFIPRDRNKSNAAGMSGLVGGLEVLGELVFSSDAEKTRLENGEIDYLSIWNTLKSVHTPFYA